MERPQFTAWITKYALTTGIQEKLVEGTHAPSMVSVVDARFQSCFHGEGKDWHRTREGAMARAEAMRFDKIANLKKQIEKLEKLRFE